MSDSQFADFHSVNFRLAYFASCQLPIANRQSPIARLSGAITCQSAGKSCIIIDVTPLSGINGDAPRLSGFGVQMARERAMKILKKLAP